MDDYHFQKLLKSAEMQAELEPDRKSYWVGYCQGLQYGFYGEKYSNRSVHLERLANIHSLQKAEWQQGLGYRNGYQKTARNGSL